jgi:hypothetical protein
MSNNTLLSFDNKIQLAYLGRQRVHNESLFLYKVKADELVHEFLVDFTIVQRKCYLQALSVDKGGTKQLLSVVDLLLNGRSHQRL